jgi:hypothetical protein
MPRYLYLYLNSGDVWSRMYKESLSMAQTWKSSIKCVSVVLAFKAWYIVLEVESFNHFALYKPIGVESLQPFPNQEDLKKLNVDWSKSKHIDPYQASKQTWNKESKVF